MKKNFKNSTKDFFKSNIGRVALVGLGVVVIWKGKYIIEKIISYTSSTSESVQLQLAGIEATYPESQYKIYAQALHEANGDTGGAIGWGLLSWNDNENSINEVFSKMNNDLDLVKLEKELISISNQTLQVYISDVFSETEIESLNLVLIANGCTKQYA